LSIQKVKKAKCFSKEEMIQIYSWPEDERTVVWAAYAAIACACVGRGMEVNELLYDQVREVTHEGKKAYKLNVVKV
jgi:hypothetical protein